MRSVKITASGREINEFKDVYIKRLAMDLSKELNFTEALNNAFLIYKKTDLSYNLERIFENEKEMTSNNSNFWLLSAALKRYYDQYGTTPVSGVFPEMTSFTDYYLELQKIYQTKAADDREALRVHLHQILKERSLSKDTVSDEELLIFCKHTNSLDHITVKSFEQELQNFTPEDYFKYELHDPETCNAWFVVLRCIEEFRQEHGYYAGLADHNADSHEPYRERAAQEFTQIQSKVDALVQQITPD